MYGDGGNNFGKGSNHYYGTAEWWIHTTRSCAVQATLNMQTPASGHKFTVEIFDENDSKKGEVTEHEWSDATGDIAVPGMIYLPKEGVYRIKLSNSAEYSSAVIAGITLSYAGGAVQNIPGTTLLPAHAILSDSAGVVAGTPDYINFKVRGSHKYNADEWAKWKINVTSAGSYTFTASVTATSGQYYALSVLDNTESTTLVGSIAQTSDIGSGDKTVSTEPILLEVGEYFVKIVNPYPNSNGCVLNVVATYAGGGTVTIPATLMPIDATFSDNASIKDGKIDFHPGDYSSLEWAKWNITTNGGDFKFTINAYNSEQGTGQTYTIKVYDPADEANPKINETSGWDENEGAYDYTTAVASLDEGDYVVMVQNSTNWSVGRVVNVVANYLGGAVVNLPADPIPLTDANLSPLASKEAVTNYIHFTTEDGDEEYVASQWAKWNIHADEGVYTFTFGVNGPDHGNYVIKISDKQNNEVYSYLYGKSGQGSYTTDAIFLKGDYTLQMQNTNPYSKGYITNISAAQSDNSNYLFFDENAEDNSYIATHHGESKYPVLMRSFKKGMYNTLCVPFNVDSNTELKNIFGEGYELLEMTSATLEGEVLTLEFNAPAELIHHGDPYLIKPTKDVLNPIFSRYTHTISKSTEYNKKEGTDADFLGSFIKTTILASPNNLFVTNNDKLVFPATDKVMKGFRAYFQVKVPNASNVIQRARIVTEGQVATEIELVDGNIIDLSKTQKLIIDGQLIIIKDGVQYNAFGVRVK